jgi:sugar O-acyltransferase (sialic acid O-acetyltransferase NeuD family)
MRISRGRSVLDRQGDRGLNGGRLLVIGAGGHGRVVADTAASSGTFSRIAFVDDAYPDSRSAGAWPVVGRISTLSALRAEFDACVPAMGKGTLRLEVFELARAAGFDMPAIIHPRAVVSEYASIGAGSVVIGGAVVNVGVSVGVACIVNTGATIDHDCQLADGVHVCPGVSLAGNVKVGSLAWLGIGSCVIQGRSIGARATVGAGSVVIRDVEEGVTVVGNPARRLRDE